VRLPFEELDRTDTPMGTLVLRRRTDPVLGEIEEVKLGDEYLMSSAFTAAEVALARLGLAAAEGDQLDIVVGGLGLGYTAQAALEDDRVGALVVVETMREVIGWHERGLLPVSPALTSDRRTRFVRGDFFAMAAGAEGFDPDAPARRFHVVLLDVDHSPRHVLDPSHAPFYTPAGLRRLADHLHPGGVFALWSDDPADDRFVDALREVFGDVGAHVVRFPNPLTDAESANTVYVAR
jgi:spermidine synthase